MEWFGDSILSQLSDVMGQRVQGAGTDLQGAIKQNISIDVSAGRNSRSKPGEYPRRDTGKLMDGIAVEFDANELVASVGTSVPEGIYTEFGTLKMAPRPWLRRTLAEKTSSIADRLMGRT